MQRLCLCRLRHVVLPASFLCLVRENPVKIRDESIDNVQQYLNSEVQVAKFIGVLNRTCGASEVHNKRRWFASGTCWCHSLPAKKAPIPSNTLNWPVARRRTQR